MLANPRACDAEVEHEKENMTRYALAAWTEHRSDGDQEHRIEVCLDCALSIRNLLSEHSSDGEVMSIPHTVKERTESPPAAKLKKTTDKKINSHQPYPVFDPMPLASVLPEPNVFGTTWAFKVKVNHHTVKGGVVVYG